MRSCAGSPERNRGGNSFTNPEAESAMPNAVVKKWVDHAAVLGALHIRVFAGALQKGGHFFEKAKELSISALEECGEYAGGRRDFSRSENHGGIVAEPAALLEIVRAVKSQWVGINLDTGNFRLKIRMPI
jgi:sugar phosphate isomerase/epimerase